MVKLNEPILDPVLILYCEHLPVSVRLYNFEILNSSFLRGQLRRNVNKNTNKKYSNLAASHEKLIWYYGVLHQGFYWI